MTVEEYIKKKNEILLDLINVELVPEDQIVDFEPVPLNLSEADGGICPYCIKYNAEIDHTFVTCKDCPMDIAGNNCNGYSREDPDENPTDSYHQVLLALREKYGDKGVRNLISIPEILDLAEEYNLSNGFPSLIEE